MTTSATMAVRAVHRLRTINRPGGRAHRPCGGPPLFVDLRDEGGALLSTSAT